MLECWKETASRSYRWEEERKGYGAEKGGEGSRRTRSNAYERPEHLAQIERTEQGQSRYDRIVKGRYHGKCRVLRKESEAEWPKNIVEKE